MIIITGCPKSGTQYTAVTLLAMGLDIRHEEQGADGIADWRLAPGKKQDTDIILHQIREPLACMSSCQNISDEAWEYIYNFLTIREKPLTERLLYLYYSWNLVAERQAAYSYKIEYLPHPAKFVVFCDKIQHPELKGKYHIMKYIPSNLNTAKPYKKLTWNKLLKVNKELTKKIQEMAWRYGYRY